MNRSAISLAAAAAVLTTACNSISGTYPRDGGIIPDASIQVSEGYTITMEDLVYSGAAVYLAYLVIDPLAPNWEIKETKLGEEEYRLSLRMKRFHTGGDGEARVVFNRRAEALAREGGYASYDILAYNEGIDSGLIAQRVSEGTVRLMRGVR